MNEQPQPAQAVSEKKGSFVNAWKILKESISFIIRKPVFLSPLLVTWLITATVILYLRYWAPTLSDSQTVVVVFLFILGLSYLISLSNLLMLELIQQLERGQALSFGKALREVITLDAIKVVPIAVLWAVLWFIIMALKAATSKKKSGGRSEPSMQDAARTLSGMNSGPFSWTRLGLDLIEKLVRMTMFMALPAIAWENKGPVSSLAQAITIIRQQPKYFLSGYTMTLLVTLIIAVPLVVINQLDDGGVAISDAVWTGVIVYSAIVWSFQLYLEQMFTANLYLWYLKWVKNGSVGDLSSVERPELLDSTYEL